MSSVAEHAHGRRERAKRSRRVLRSLPWLAIAFLAGTAASIAYAPGAYATPATVLLAKYAELSDKLENNPFRKRLYLESDENSGEVKGTLYAVIAEPFPVVQSALKEPAHWCDILILHLNTKYCRASLAGAWAVLKVNIGRKAEQPVAQSVRVEFSYRVIATAPDRLAVVLEAAKGPFGTRNYSILLEAVPLPEEKTFVRLAYSYAYGAAANVAMHAYLATAGSRKVGFTVTGMRSDGQLNYVDGLRGLIERNTMRYYLAIEAYLGALSVPPAAQFEKSLKDWYVATERYPRQLHEIEKNDYLEMKRREYVRQQREY